MRIGLTEFLVPAGQPKFQHRAEFHLPSGAPSNKTWHALHGCRATYLIWPHSCQLQLILELLLGFQ